MSCATATAIAKKTNKVTEALTNPTPVPTTYAGRVNSRYNNTASHIVTPKQRWDMTYNLLSQHNQQMIDFSLEQAKYEFRRRNPNIKNWSDINLAEAKSVPMSTVSIDGSMQRLLNIDWLLDLLTKFESIKIMPIQVYRPDPTNDEFLAWDGQHTLLLLWIISTQILGMDPKDVMIPVNVYKSDSKAEMRTNFVVLNSNAGKKQLDTVDIFQQMVFGVRADGNTSPDWVEAEKKQQHIEKNDLFVTAKKFSDDHEVGAISRLQEINKMTPESVGWLSKYLALVAKNRCVAEKEMVMMGQYFDRCRTAGIKVDNSYIIQLATVAKMLWDADFEPNGKFWNKAAAAYYNWHTKMGNYSNARFSKEPPHGMPFLLAQLRKSFNGKIPANTSTSEFVPAAEDLF